MLEIQWLMMAGWLVGLLLSWWLTFAAEILGVTIRQEVLEFATGWHYTVYRVYICRNMVAGYLSSVLSAISCPSSHTTLTFHRVAPVFGAHFNEEVQSENSN